MSKGRDDGGDAHDIDEAGGGAFVEHCQCRRHASSKEWCCLHVSRSLSCDGRRLASHLGPMSAQRARPRRHRLCTLGRSWDLAAQALHDACLAVLSWVVLPEFNDGVLVFISTSPIQQGHDVHRATPKYTMRGKVKLNQAASTAE